MCEEFTMEKLLLSADGDILLYEVDKNIIRDFDDILEEFYAQKTTNCYDEQLFVRFLQRKFDCDKIKFIKKAGCVGSDLSEEHQNIKWHNF